MRKLETDRLLIRDFVPEDVWDLHEILGDPETMKYCEPAYDLEKTRAFLESFCIGKKGAVAAVEKGSQKLIGYILFHETEPAMYEIGWFFNRGYWRQGYAFEACKALVTYGIHEKKVRKVFAETIDPVKSAGLMKKLGMSLESVQERYAQDNEGNWADLYSYSVKCG